MPKNTSKSTTYKNISIADIEAFFANRSNILQNPNPDKPKTKPFDASAIQEACRLELKRILHKQLIKDGPKAFFVSAIVKDSDEISIQSTSGALFTFNETRDRIIHLNVKTGTNKANEFSNNTVTETRTEDNHMLPLSDEIESLRDRIWLIADEAFRRSVSIYYNQMSEVASGSSILAKNMGEWTTNPQAPDNQQTCKKYILQKNFLVDYANKLSKYLKQKEEVTDHIVELHGRSTANVLYTSDGVETVYPSSVISLNINFTIKHTKKHKEVIKIIYHSSAYAEELPPIDALIFEIDASIAYTMLQRLNKPIERYIGPVLLTALSAGTFFHEVIGHRMESGRVLSTEERSGILGDNGLLVDKSLVFYDDPNIQKYKGVTLIGSYQVDEEGVTPKAVNLVQNGSAINLLSTRSSIKKRGHRSNGHARSDGRGYPEARMGVSVVTTDGSKPTFDWDALKGMLIQEIVKQNLEFGIIILEAQHGETSVSAWDIQSFKGETSVMLMINRKGGVQAIEPMDFVGVPLSALKSIIAMGDKTTESVENHGCGSDSGFIPVSTICIPILVSSVEMQHKPEFTEPPLLPHPKFI